MRTCGSCGNELGEADRFCGECGSAIPLLRQQPSERAVAAVPAPAPPAKLLRRLAYTALGITLCAGAGATYYAISNELAPSEVIRITLGEASRNTEDPIPEAEISDSPIEAETQAIESPSDTLPTPAAISSADADMLIEPGNWSFTTLLTNVTKVNSSDTSFQLSRQGIGSSESHSLCILPASAANPRSIGFPFRGSMDCNTGNASMANGRYRGNMSCNLPQYGGRRPVDADGQYTAEGIALALRVRVPAEVVSGDFRDPPEIYLHYRLTGTRTGPC